MSKRVRGTKILAVLLCVILTAAMSVSRLFAAEIPAEDMQNRQEQQENAPQVSMELSSPSALLMESSTGQVIYEKDADTRRSPASITKIMTLLLVFEAIDQGKIALTDEVTVSANAMSMGGSQVYLAEGEKQTVETMIKCIVISSGNDASVAMAEFIDGSEEIFVDHMNEKAAELHMDNTHFTDCSGLTNDDEHYTSARDVALMTQELINRYPSIFNYSMIWMEDITHVTRQGTSTFTLSSTNKLLKQYEYSTGLKTGSTKKAKYCYSGTACKDGISLIAVVMAAPDYKVRFEEAKKLLQYGYSVASLYRDENQDEIAPLKIRGGVSDTAQVIYENSFSYLDLKDSDLSGITKELVFMEKQAPVLKGECAGSADYYLNGQKIGSVRLLYAENVRRAGYADYLKKVVRSLWL